MIDWWGLVRNTLWILGLSVCLAALSMLSYRARVEQVRLRDLLNEPRSQLVPAAGLLLFCLGILVTSRTWWQAFLAGLLLVLLAAYLIYLWRHHLEEP
jgi:hypothetical protein